MLYPVIYIEIDPAAISINYDDSYIAYQTSKGLKMRSKIGDVLICKDGRCWVIESIISLKEENQFFLWKILGGRIFKATYSYMEIKLEFFEIKKMVIETLKKHKLREIDLLNHCEDDMIVDVEKSENINTLFDVLEKWILS